jgi:hypothetical protein
MTPSGQNWIETLQDFDIRILAAEAAVREQAARVLGAIEERHDIEEAKARFTALQDALDQLRRDRDAWREGRPPRD